MESLGLSAADIHKYACNGFRAAFLPEAQREQYVAKVDAAFKQVMGEAAFNALTA